MRQAIATVKRQKRFKKSIRFSQRKALDRILLLNRVLLKRLLMQRIQSRDELVFEIGPGIGALTQFLCEKSNQVVAF